jgi:hypothetical protein
MRYPTAVVTLLSAWATLLLAPCVATASPPTAGMNMSDMKTAVPLQPAAAPALRAYTDHHVFLVELRSAPRPIPFERYFTLQLTVFDGRRPARALPDAHLVVAAGMRHGLKEGFAHGIQSTPRIVVKDGHFHVSGMYFHMYGPWILEVEVHRHGRKGTAYFTLPCCAQ